MQAEEDSLRKAFMREERKKGVEADEALALEATLRAIQEIDLEQLLEEKAKMPMSGEELANKLRQNKRVEAIAPSRRKKKPGPRKKHWKAKQKVKRAKDKRYRERRRKMLRRDKLAEAALDASKCYAYKLQRWLEVGTEVELTEKEWVEEVWPELGGMWPAKVFRHEKEKPISVENIYILATKRDVVLFDGKEHMLRKQGYIC